MKKKLEIQPLAQGGYFSLDSNSKSYSHLRQPQKEEIYWIISFPSVHKSRGNNGTSLQSMSFQFTHMDQVAQTMHTFDCQHDNIINTLDIWISLAL